jgi:MoaA/NifB/PqqE/SkfB family radical SAM enzyme
MNLLVSAARWCRRAFNRELNQIAYNRQMLDSPGVPEIFQIELTNHCPMACVMCPRTRGMTRPLGHMDAALFQHIIREAAPFTSKLFLHHFGDSLLHPALGECISFARQFNVRTYLSANPILLSELRIRELVDAGLHELVLSLDGATAATSEAVRGRAARDVAEAERRILSLLAYRQQRASKTPIVILQFVRQRMNRHEIGPWLAKWTAVPGIDAIKLKSFVAWDGQDAHINALRIEPIPAPSRIVCDKPWTSVTVLWDGRVVPCCFDHDGLYVLGHLGQQSLREILLGEPMRNLRRMHRDGNLSDVDLCARCVDKEGYPPKMWYYPLNRLLWEHTPLGKEDRIEANS